MKQFVEFLPIALFVAVYFYTKDIYISTGVLMGGMCVQIGYEYGKFRRVTTQTLVIFWVVIIFGGATLLFRNQEFIQWKPTVVNWLFCLALLIGKYVAKENLLKRLLGSQLSLPDRVWNTLAMGWSFGFFIAGALNLIVAYGFSLDFWVSYKLIGGFAITLLYITITVVYLVKGGHIKDSEEIIDQNQ